MKRYLVAFALTVSLGAMGVLGYQGPPRGGAGQAPGGVGAGGPGARGAGQAPGGGIGGGAGARGGRGAPAGPPAPVPAEVAIPRPTADEVTRINAGLKRLVETNTGSDSALLKKYADLVNVPMPRANSAIAPSQRNNDRHNGFVEVAKTDFDILFAGDSITDWWQQGAAQGGGTDVQKKHFGDIKIANFAIAGDTTQGVLWGLQNGEGQGHKPKAVMLMVGTNNTGPNTGPEIAEGVGAVVYELRKDFPDAKILLLAIFPRGASPTDGSRMKNDEANKIIAKLHDGKHVFFKNINDKFLNPQGGLIGFRNDNLHPNPEGYEIWANAVGDTLKGWLK